MNNEKPYLKKYIGKFKKVPNDTFYTGMLDDIKNTYSELSSAEIPTLPFTVKTPFSFTEKSFISFAEAPDITANTSITAANLHLLISNSIPPPQPAA